MALAGIYCVVYACQPFCVCMAAATALAAGSAAGMVAWAGAWAWRRHGAGGHGHVALNGGPLILPF